MRRYVALTLALLMLCAALPAAATQNGTQARAMLVKRWNEQVEWIDDIGLLKIQGANGAWGVYDVMGSMLTGTVYADLHGYYGRIYARDIRVEGVNGCGVIGASGQQLIPFRYGRVQPLSERWSIGLVLHEAGADAPDVQVNDAGYAIERADVYYGSSPQLVASLDRASYQAARAYGDFINVQARDTGAVNTHDAGFGLVAAGVAALDDWSNVPRADGVVRDESGFWMTDSQGDRVNLPYDEVGDFVAGYSRVRIGEKNGFINSEGREVVPVAFDSMLYLGNAPRDAGHGWGLEKTPVLHGGVALLCGGEVCYADLRKGQVWRSGVDEANVDMEGLCGVLLDADLQVHVVAADGAHTVIAQLSPEAVEAGTVGIDGAEYTGGFFLKWLSEAGLQGMLDWHGNEVIPCRYADLAVAPDGQYVLARLGDGGVDVYQLTYPSWQLPEDDTEELRALAAQFAANGGAAEAANAGTAEAANAGTAEAGNAGTAGAAEAGSGAEDMERVRALLTNARALLELNASANRKDVALMLEGALAALEGKDEAMGGMIESALASLNTGGRLGGSAALRQLDAILAQLPAEP